ncbi:hypothetical protein AGLY_001088 [Aphis glycines]|uniref:Uncharacterized protein n=1 Tax=Aphis glycines TaxID=307491 RepID=A0A6G0U8T3_APHGL|nr:hypothetical protein AGLY_001088 [Aphis glycines]
MTVVTLLDFETDFNTSKYLDVLLYIKVIKIMTLRSYNYYLALTNITRYLSLTVPMQNPRIVYEEAKYNFKSAFLNYTQRCCNIIGKIKLQTYTSTKDVFKENSNNSIPTLLQVGGRIQNKVCTKGSQTFHGRLRAEPVFGQNISPFCHSKTSISVKIIPRQPFLHVVSLAFKKFRTTSENPNHTVSWWINHTKKCILRKYEPTKIFKTLTVLLYSLRSECIDCTMKCVFLFCLVSVNTITCRNNVSI